MEGAAGFGPSVVRSQSIEEIGEPLSPEQAAVFGAALKEAATVINTTRDRERKVPLLDFIAAAEAAGFTAGQAEFLWSIRYRPEPRF